MSATEIKPQHVMAEVDRISNGEAIVTTDVGQHQMWAAQFIRFNQPRLWLTSGGLGSMGFSLPAAMGAQVANPGKLVFCLVGDGGFQMTLPELSTISANGLPVKIVVVNNGHLGHGPPVAGVVLQQPHLRRGTRVFSGCGEAGRRLRNEGPHHRSSGRLRPALEEAVAEPGPFLLNVKVSPFENVYPMVPAGAAINEMVLTPPQPVAVAK